MKRLLPVLMVFGMFLGGAGESFARTQCKGSPAEDRSVWGQWDDCEGTVTFASEEKEEELAAVSSSYVGEFKEGKRHGNGTYIYINGDKYVGEFKDNKRHGHGTYHHTSGNKYVGEYKDGKKHGQGTVTFANGDKFVGTFRNGKVRWSQKMGKSPN